MRPWRRKNFLINKEIQIKYVVLSMLLLVSYTFLLLLAIFAPYVMAIFSDIPLSEQAAAAEVILILHSDIWPWIGFLIILCGIYSIFVTHKMAGPIFVLNRTAKQITDGDLSVRVKLRKGDDLRDVAESFNVMVESIESLLIELDDEQKKLSAYTSELERELIAREMSEDAIADMVENMTFDRERIKNILGRYKFRSKS